MADSTVPEGGVGPSATHGAPRQSSGHQPTTLDMVLAALQADQENSRKGTSVIAIKKWIEDQYPDTNRQRLKGLLRNALEKGLTKKVVERPKKTEEGAATLVGRYRLGKPPKPAKPVKAKKPAGRKAKEDGGDKAGRARSTTPKAARRGRPVPRARARSVSATPRVSKSKKVRSRLSKSHSPLRTPKPTKAKAKTAGVTTTTAAAAGKKKKPAVKSSKSPAKPKTPPKKKAGAAKAPTGAQAAEKPTKAVRGAKPPAKATGKAAQKDGGKKKK